MSAILDKFKVKEIDLEPIFASWTTAPIFNGNPKRDLPVVEWLEQIKAGCKQRNIPRAYWHKVAYHYMGKKAKARLDEVKKVMRNLVGGKFKWNWKTFKVAMRNLGWDIDEKKTQAFEVQSKPSGVWWIVGRGKSEEKLNEKDSDTASIKSGSSARPTPKKSKTWDIPTLKSFPTPKRSSTTSEIETISSSKKSAFSSAPSEAPSTSSGFASFFRSAPVSAPPPDTIPSETATAVANAPVWLLNACQALEFLTTEHPKVMTTISAVLITVGSIPALPVISAGAGGAFLASGTAHAIGSIAVGIGSLLQAQARITDTNSTQATAGTVVKK
ncbi:hypothetical protein EIP91_006410 [Steccherinum ochraceum]|uniref:Uncharacterized protein n=1 Tax=Steccherinum ochraceum TaxID=92696 RepID=A0A4R0R5Z5_9APHY|nr:hypothetical protein EIP91_006410 [Steccherinum ochraceum]